MMLKIIAGLTLGFLIGAGSRWADIPVPSPPTIIGALLVVSITLGYVTMDRVITARSPEASPPTPRVEVQPARQSD